MCSTRSFLPVRLSSDFDGHVCGQLNVLDGHDDPGPPARQLPNQLDAHARVRLGDEDGALVDPVPRQALSPLDAAAPENPEDPAQRGQEPDHGQEKERGRRGTARSSSSVAADGAAGRAGDGGAAAAAVLHSWREQVYIALIN